MDETFGTEIVARDGVWSVEFRRQPGQASWADAAFVWLAVAESSDERRHTSLWAIDGVVLARLKHTGFNEEVALEVIVAEYRRRVDAVLDEQSARTVIKQADYNRLTTTAGAALERVGREIDRVVFQIARRIPAAQRFASEGGTQIELGLPPPEIWAVESVVMEGVDESIVKFYEGYERSPSRQPVTPSNVQATIIDLRRLVRLGGVARRKMWAPAAPPQVTPPQATEPEQRRTVPGFELGEKLGEGGFGVVHHAKDAAGVERAVKLLLPIVVLQQDNTRERFQREAVALSRLRHRNIVQYLMLAEGTGGWYLVMEFVRGRNLHRWAAEQPYTDRIRVIADVLDGLHHMHERDVVHRDLKPSNIVIEEATGRAVIVDLGLAWIVEEGAPDFKTRVSTWSAAYAPPESLAAPESSRVPTHDIFSMGVVLYEILAGNRRGRVDGVPLASVADELKPIDAIVERATARQTSRFQTAAEFAAALRDAASQAPTERELQETVPPAAQSPDETPGVIPKGDATAHALRALELRKREAEAAVHGELSIVTMSTGGEGTEIVLRIENTGRSGFFIDSVEWRLEWRVGLGAQTLPAGYAPPSGRLKSPREGIIPPGGTVQLPFKWPRDDAFAHFRDNQLNIDDFNGRWFAYHFEIQCHTDLGGVGTLRCVAK